MSTQPDGEFRIRTGLEPGDLGDIVAMHGRVYAAEHGLDHTFEPYVAKRLSEFVLAGSGAGQVWIAARGTAMVGSIAMVLAGPRLGQLRWFLLLAEARGKGLGKRLMGEAMTYASNQGMERVFLWTFEALTPAIALYERYGFSAREEKRSLAWGAERREVRMDATAPFRCD